MIDHLLTFADEDAAAEALDAALPPGWRARAIWPTRIVLPDESDVPGFHVTIAEMSLSEALRDLPGNACRLIADREASVRGASREEFTLYLAPDMNMTVLDVARVEPTFAGARYPFGS